MGEQGQTAEKQTRPTARVNGELVRRAPRGQVDKRRYNADIFWLLNESAGALGERGSNFSADGGGNHDPREKQFRLYQERRNAVLAVEKERRLLAVWRRLDTKTRGVLECRYSSRNKDQEQIAGLFAAFSDLGRLAWALCEDQQELRRVLSGGGKGRDKVIGELRRLAESTNREAHIAWLEAEREGAMWVECPPRSVG